MGEPHGGVSSVDPGKERSPGVMSFSCERAVKILPLGKLKINFYFYSTYAYLCLMILRQANLCDIESILAITDAARDFQRSSGFVQWEDGYPNCSIIETDIAKGTGYVLVDDKLPICYVVLAEGDSGYDSRPAIWNFDEPYGAVHRMAVAPEIRGQHITDILFPLIEKEYQNRNINVIRIDTGEHNIIMQRLMNKFGYESRGMHQFPWGQRIAYEKKLR